MRELVDWFNRSIEEEKHQARPHRQGSGFVEGASLYDAFAFPDGDKMTGGKRVVLLDESEGPMDLNVSGGCGAEAEV